MTSSGGRGPSRRLVAAVVLVAATAGGGAALVLTGAPPPASPAPATVAVPVVSTSSSTTTTTTSTTTTLPPPRHATLAFTGDLLPHSPVTRQAAANAAAAGGAGYDFGPMFDLVRPILSGADLALCHLETPVSADDSDIRGYPVFSGPWELVAAAAEAGYDGCSTASNHSFDRGRRGVEETIEVLDRFGLGHAGTAVDPDSDLEPVLYDAGGITVGHVAATYGLNGFQLPADAPHLVDLIEPDDILLDARRAREAGAELVVVSLHWGVEYRHEPTTRQQAWLESILPSPDVDLVVGHHAHVVQPVDRLGDEWVVYGLGNFLSNQSANCCVAASQDGVIVLVDVDETSPGVVEVTGVRYVPTWVDRSDYTIVPVAEALADPDLDEGRRRVLEDSWERTTSVVGSRLGPPDGPVAIGAWPDDEGGSSDGGPDLSPPAGGGG